MLRDSAFSASLGNLLLAGSSGSASSELSAAFAGPPRMQCSGGRFGAFRTLQLGWGLGKVATTGLKAPHAEAAWV